MTTLSPEQAVDGFLGALRAGDVAHARAFLADEGFSYKSPIGAYHDADEFVDGVLLGLIGILDRITLRRRLVEGNEVFDVLTLRTRLSKVTESDAVQWAVVEHGKITSIEAFFDAHEYKMMFQQRFPFR